MFKLINLNNKVNYYYDCDDKKHWKRNYSRKNKWNTVITMTDVFNKDLKND